MNIRKIKRRIHKPVTPQEAYTIGRELLGLDKPKSKRKIKRRKRAKGN